MYKVPVIRSEVSLYVLGEEENSISIVKAYFRKKTKNNTWMKKDARMNFCYWRKSSSYTKIKNNKRSDKKNSSFSLPHPTHLHLVSCILLPLFCFTVPSSASAVQHESRECEQVCARNRLPKDSRSTLTPWFFFYFAYLIAQTASVVACPPLHSYYVATHPIHAG